MTTRQTSRQTRRRFPPFSIKRLPHFFLLAWLAKKDKWANSRKMITTNFMNENHGRLFSAAWLALCKKIKSDGWTAKKYYMYTTSWCNWDRGVLPSRSLLYVRSISVSQSVYLWTQGHSSKGCGCLSLHESTKCDISQSTTLIDGPGCQSVSQVVFPPFKKKIAKISIVKKSWGRKIQRTLWRIGIIRLQEC